MVNTDRTELIDDDSHPPAMVGGQNAIEESGFPCAQKSGQDSDGYPLIVYGRHGSKSLESDLSN
jgi:hypothetical protein